MPHEHAPAADTQSAAPGEVDAVLSRLSVHAAAERQGRGGKLPATSRWLRAVVSRKPKGERPARLTLRIDDLAGRCVHASTSAAKRVDVSLPAGAYHVTAAVGAATQRYTLKLAAGAVLHLYLRPVAEAD